VKRFIFSFNDIFITAAMDFRGARSLGKSCFT